MPVESACPETNCNIVSQDRFAAPIWRANVNKADERNCNFITTAAAMCLVANTCPGSNLFHETIWKESVVDIGGLLILEQRRFPSAIPTAAWFISNFTNCMLK